MSTVKILVLSEETEFLDVISKSSCDFCCSAALVSQVLW